MSETHGGAPEYLEAGAGSPLPPEPPSAPAGGGGRRRGLLIGGGVAALALVGVGAWAATQFFATGEQPAAVLPASTIGYASIDLDPSGAQKIEALKTLNKFPAFKDEFGLDATDDIRQKIFDEIDLPAGCKLFYDEDIKPWLGERMAVAAVDTGADEPEVAVVIQVKDQDAADKGLAKLRDCGQDESERSGGWVFDGDWAIVAEDTEGAQAIADANDKGTLADDDDFQELTSAAGDPGIVSLYAAPGAAKFLGREAGGVGGMADDLSQGLFGGDVGLQGLDSDSGNGEPSISKALEGFKGLAVTVRFDSGALEIESAGSLGPRFDSFLATDRGTDVLETLPADTAAAIGVGFEEGWLTRLAEQMASVAGEGTSVEDLFKEASEASGLDLPQDAETLFGSSSALSFGSDFDPEAFFNSGDPGDLPIAFKAKGDPDAAAKVVDKIVAQDPEAADFFGIDSDGDVFAIGPNADYRKAVLGDGGLGDDPVFKDVIRESDKASAVFYVNFNAGDDWLVRLVGDSDPSVTENVKPLAGFGITAWKDGDWTHGVLRVTTD